MKNKILFFFMCFLFCGYVNATSYDVAVVSSGKENVSLGSYDNYETAKEVMNSYASDEKNVAVIYRDGKIINAKYAISNFNYDKSSPDSGSTSNIHRLFADTTTNTVYTRVSAAYGIDSAFLDYDVQSDRAKIKISGYTGWTYLSNIDIIPISALSTSVKIESNTAIRVRSDHNLGASELGFVSKGNIYQYYDVYNDEQYTWYKIYYNGSYGWFASKDETWAKIVDASIETYYEHYSTGNLIHYYKSHWGQLYTNLGPSPSYLKEGNIYYSFDGNYFYEDYKTMIEDYKNGNYDHALNKNEPHYAYYLYLTNHTKTGYTADDFDQIIKNYGYNSKQESALYGEGESFILSQETYGVNALLTFSAALNESAKGTSSLALNKNNLFGHGAYDNCPYECATTYSSARESILAHAKMTGSGYNSPDDWRYYGAHYGNKQSGMNIQYATDPYWGEKAAGNAYTNDKNFGMQDYLSNTIGIKVSSVDVPVKKQPSDSSETIYTLKNKNTSVENIPVIVFDKVDENGSKWYKVYTDAALDENQNIASIDYDFKKSYGYIKEEYLYVSNHQPVITAENREINVGDSINLLEGVSAYDDENGDLTSKIQVSSDINPLISGTYKVTYTVEDESKFSVSKTISINVVGHTVPEITAEDKELIQYKEYDILENVKANDLKDGDLTTKISIKENNVDIKTPGEYKVVYSVINSYEVEVTKEIKVTVIENQKPVISVTNKTVLFNSEFDPMAGVSAQDHEDGDLTDVINVIKNEVDTSKLGNYEVIYQVSDKDGKKTEVTVTYEVTKKELVEKEGRFYLSSLKEDDGKLIIKGYQTIEGMDNTLDEDIKYELVLKNEQTNKVYTQTLNRLEKTKEMDMPILSSDGKDYTYSWFKDEIDVDQFEQGDYKVHVRASTSDCYSESIVQNILFNEQEVQFNTEKRYVTIINDYLSDDIPMIFVIRNEKIANKQSDFANTQYTYIDKAELQENELYLNFASYSVGVNMKSDAEVSRTVILENIETYERKIYEVDVNNQGPFVPQLLQKDAFGLQKEKSWSQLSIDINDLEKGKYRIYIVNTSNITDYAEMNDILFTDLSKATGKVGTKNVSMSVNEDLRNRIELYIH